ncbi:MAG: glycosyltransferase [Pseudomonadota bacterium]
MNASIDIEFSSALSNRTGKYFIGRTLLDLFPEQVQRLLFWRVSCNHVPRGIIAKALGKAISLEHRFRLPDIDGSRFKMSGGRPVLHLDPFSVCHWSLRPQDIVLCHDVGPLTHADLFDRDVTRLYEAAYQYIHAKKPRMVFVSHSTMKAFISAVGEMPDMRVIYPPIRSGFNEAEPERVDIVGATFLLTVGNVGARKNHRMAIEAYRASGLHQEGVQYVICGGREPGWENVVEIASRTPGVILLPYVSEGSLRWLYEHAAGFLLPSRLEGFGLPAAEAIYYNLVPIVPEGSVLHEVSGDGALLVDACDTQSISGAMNALVRMNAEERANRLSLLHTAVERFDTQRFAQGWSAVLGKTT